MPRGLAQGRLLLFMTMERSPYATSPWPQPLGNRAISMLAAPSLESNVKVGNKCGVGTMEFGSNRLGTPFRASPCLWGTCPLLRDARCPSVMDPSRPCHQNAPVTGFQRSHKNQGTPKIRFLLGKGFACIPAFGQCVRGIHGSINQAKLKMARWPPT